ncbi:tyrosine-protein phosphatase [Pseudosporangium ferrugineum]|uniref:Protein tyrosine/serine phosphatase n=1 Tax=Pseudosporangium ferrugineum TaxID=439699 RepID=A0A2T0SFT8_9ACTN|nr:tyrosine-protein phosphatase [Pseudosporangium ferrugineum]PRY32276.1 protein tyrosine/serine phosphatase [Pseudosporangium ferrugineum]
MILDWPGCRNARDVGGLPTVDGASIRAGALLRSDHHARLTPAAMERIRAAGVSRIVDLRWPHELDEHPSPFAGDPVYVHVPLLMDPITYDYTDESYGPLLDHNRKHVAAAFRAVATAPPGGVLVHCHGGRDRTGIVVALALAAAGVAPAAIAEDYALTADALAATMLNTLDHAEREYGGVEAYLRTAGVTRSEIDAVRERLREPSFLTEARAGYDAFAGEYADRFRDELAHKHWDRALLNGLADVLRAAPGPVLDVGSGPGVVTAYLKGLGLDVSGVDLSPEMVAIARRDHPGIPFTTGSMTSLNRPDATVAAVVAWYSIIHVPDEELPTVLAEFRRVLRPGGHLFLAFQVGDDERHHRGLTFRRRRPAQVTDALRTAGFEIRLETVRAPDDYVVLKEQSPQAYVLARSEL